VKPTEFLRTILVAVLAAIAVLSLACSSDDNDGDNASDGTEQGEANGSDPEAATEPLTVLVTNDDGVGSEGIDHLVDALEERDDVEVVVVAPAENQSGSGQKTTDGELVANDATTASGHEATAVEGFPADSVVWALGEGGIEPDLVISGINEGQNIAQLATISGTVGAARQAAQSGVPAVAASQGIGEPPDYETGTEAVMEWLDENIDSVRDGSYGTEEVVSINIPTCETGEVQGTVEVPWAEESDLNLVEVDCAGTVEPTDDAVGFTNGWIVVTPLEPTGSST
jgi:5'-nucleotidase